MRTKVFSQLDTRWASLPYPDKTYTIRSSGCGCCSVTNVIIETSKYWEYTPKDVQPYMKQYAVAGSGTLWSGITKSLDHYGLKAIMHDSVTDMFKTLNNRKKRMGVLLFRSGTVGGVTWTTSGHYIAFTNYKVKNGKHYFYTKDSGGRGHTGWYCFETQMKGCLFKCWSAILKDTKGRQLCKKALKTFDDMHALDFKYQASGNATSWSKAKVKKTSNCATFVSYCLQRMNLLKEGQVFWCNDGVVRYKGNGTEKRLKKIANITHPKKAPKQCQLMKGDICGYSNPPHTQIFYRYDASGNALWFSFGESDLWKKRPRQRGNYNTKKIDTIIRLK